MPETGTDSEDYELLLPAEVEQPARLKQSMGQDEQFTKLEGRKGDLLTKYAALVRYLEDSLTTGILPYHSLTYQTSTGVRTSISFYAAKNIEVTFSC